MSQINPPFCLDINSSGSVSLCAQLQILRASSNVLVFSIILILMHLLMTKLHFTNVIVSRNPQVTVFTDWASDMMWKVNCFFLQMYFPEIFKTTLRTVVQKSHIFPSFYYKSKKWVLATVLQNLRYKTLKIRYMDLKQVCEDITKSSFSSLLWNWKRASTAKWCIFLIILYRQRNLEFSLTALLFYSIGSSFWDWILLL